MKIRIERVYYPQLTTGLSFVLDDFGRKQFTFRTLELPWKDNKPRVSCIPEGTYKAIKHISPKFNKSFWLQNVPGRSEILVHPGNYTSQILGCILPGETIQDINGDTIDDVTKSGPTLNLLWDMMPEEFDIEIVQYG